MTQEEKWQNRYDEVMEFMELHHRNPSKHRIEEHLMLNWMKHQRKLMNRGEMKPERVGRLNALLMRAERYKRVNQWEDTKDSILIEDKLQDYQREMLDRVYYGWKSYQSIMVQMPTGTGKTHLMAAAIRDHTDGGVLVVAHRRELIAQISQTLDGFGVEHGLIVSGKDIDYSQKVQVASIQTLTRRMAHAESLTLHFSLVVVDEAHHALADTYRMLWDEWPDARFLGLTATPCRLNNAPFTDLFQTLLQSCSIQEFIDKGYLSDFEYVSAAPYSEALMQVRKLCKRGADGDYQQKELALVMDVPESIEHLYKTYKQFADGKKGIVYAIDRHHARHITDYYQAKGVSCCLIDGKELLLNYSFVLWSYYIVPFAMKV